MELTKLKGIGEKTAALYEKLGIRDTEDLIGFYPRDYEEYKPAGDASEFACDSCEPLAVIEGVVAKRPDIIKRNNKTIITCLISDKKGNVIRCVWFNTAYIYARLKCGMRWIFRGRIKKERGSFLLSQPEIYSLADYGRLAGRLVPIYPLTKGLTSKAVGKAVSLALEIKGEAAGEDYLPPEIVRKYKLMSEKDALQNIHFPAGKEEVGQARKRLIFDEFFMFSLSVITRRKNLEGEKAYSVDYSPQIEEIIKHLPYPLTNSQKEALNDIFKDLKSEKVMNRLLQGDVGSGKTIVALLAMVAVAFAGGQAALLAPTEVLARQEYNDLKKLIEEESLKIKAELLVGGVSAAEKKRIYRQAQSGEIDILVGTHALLDDRVNFKNLMLAITDEQHRFGVNQRRKLSDRNDYLANILVMSATPIPRTLAWIIFGDLDISFMKEMPKGRLKIKNALINSSYRKQAYDFIRKEISAGRQAYVICPAVEESENSNLKNVKDCVEELKKEFSKDKITVEGLTGRMGAGQKTEVMKRFKAGETDILVSTTVIEVGVNVPNASVIMIENAERFGLSQLHQLRGRVGRGKYQSYCLFMSDAKSEVSLKRLEAISKTNDGFEVAEEDLKARGPGDFFGFRQTGDAQFSLADPERDAKILKEAADLARDLTDNDPGLNKESNRQIKKRLELYLENRLKRINL